MSPLRNPWPAAGWLAIALLPGCGGGERAAPDPLELAIAKPDSLSGDQQVGVAGAELELALRVVVTRDSLPAGGVPVVWRTSEGSLTPASPVTDASGVSTARWRLQQLFAQQVAGASLAFTGAPGVTFTAIATPDPRAWNTVLVGADGNRFDPAELTIEVGETVNWFWPPGSAGHNVVPDDGDSPPQSGPPVGYPKYHSYRFTAPGVYRYHCITHGAAGGGGMSGTITVVESCGTSCKE
jgi:plastocyanin